MDEMLSACFATRDRVGQEISDPRACVLEAFADGEWSGRPPSDHVQPVGSAPECRGLEPPFDQIFDVIGNVAEMVVASAPYPSQPVGYVGYSYLSGPHNQCAVEGSLAPGMVADGLGFRCCAD